MRDTCAPRASPAFWRAWRATASTAAAKTPILCLTATARAGRARAFQHRVRRLARPLPFLSRTLDLRAVLIWRSFHRRDIWRVRNVYLWTDGLRGALQTAMRANCLYDVFSSALCCCCAAATVFYALQLGMPYGAQVLEDDGAFWATGSGSCSVLDVLTGGKQRRLLRISKHRERERTGLLCNFSGHSASPCATHLLGPAVMSGI